MGETDIAENRTFGMILDDGRFEAIREYLSPDELYQDLIECVKKYHPSADISLIEKAYNTAYEAHKDQSRKSGEPYIIHPLCVSLILAELQLDKESIAAGLLHDVIEDTDVKEEDLRRSGIPEIVIEAVVAMTHRPH